MASRAQGNNPIPLLFNLAENRESFTLLQKALAIPQKGFIFCRGSVIELSRVIEFFRSDPLAQRIHFIDMSDPPQTPRALQQTIDSLYRVAGRRKGIFFIYKLEDLISRLGITEKDFWGQMNLMRDFFARFEAVFVFFMGQSLVNKMIKHAFDFYDWGKLTFVFLPEGGGLPGTISRGEIEGDMYSEPLEKIEYLKQSLEKIEDKRERAIRLFELGGLYLQVQSFTEALSCLTAALEIEKAGGDPLTEAVILEKITRVYKEKGEFSLALDSMLNALKIRGERLPAEHPYMATSYSNLSLIYRDLGQLDQALAYAQRAVAIQEKVLAADHPDRASSYNNLSLIYQDLGQLDQALAFQLKDVAISEKVLGSDHPSLATSYNNLSQIYKALGQLDQALAFQLKTNEIYEAVLESNHPLRAISYNNLCTIYYSLGQLDRALDYAQRAVAIFQRLFPNGHPNLDITRQNLASLETLTKKIPPDK